MPDDGGLDIVGVGKLAKAIPAKAWTQVVETACKTFESALAPLTATTSGIGRLISAKFDRLVDAEKILASQMMARATQKVAESKRQPSGKAKAAIVVAALEASACETDDVLRELWANLVAQEILQGQVHPEFPKILARLSATDAKSLSAIAEQEHDKSVVLKKAITKFTASISVFGLSAELLESLDATTFAHEHLANLGLIRRSQGVWALSHTGKAFIQAVTDSWDQEGAA